jgi:phosphonoacetaldehyde hydrolase
MGLNERELQELPKSEYDRRLKRAYDRMKQTGAHYVVDDITEVAPILDQIDERLANGERP